MSPLGIALRFIGLLIILYYAFQYPVPALFVISIAIFVAIVWYYNEKDKYTLHRTGQY